MKGKLFNLVILALCLSMVVSGCATTAIPQKPSVEILFHQNPVPSGVNYQPCARLRITNPPQGETVTVYVKFIELDSVGGIVFEKTIIEDIPITLSPGDMQERSYGCRLSFPPGQYTTVVQLVTPGPDGTPGTSDDVILAEDRADFEIQ